MGNELRSRAVRSPQSRQPHNAFQDHAMLNAILVPFTVLIERTAQALFGARGLRPVPVSARRART
jgi:hypothetical protein